MKRVILAGACALAFAVGGAAHAATVTGLYSTGVDDNGAALGSSVTADPHYLVTESANPAYDGLPAYVANGYYFSDDATSRWVTPGPDLGNSAVGDTTYELTFTLSGFDLSHLTLTGDFASDDHADIFLNGVDTHNHVDGFSAFQAFTVTSGFVDGANRLDFVVLNDGGPSSLRVDNLRLAQAGGAAPEPATWALMLAGFGGLGAALRRRGARRASAATA
ncbi:MAG: PEPxxWA-CTERM sorting domain-containing protein [Proteobacteria bacterium]|nr:PEPxxWA-CTERM sorting domain-containing protein [Pseudomonadota bacterium]